MLDGHPFAQFAPSLCGLLTLASLNEQSFFGMDAHTAALGTGGALLFEWALSTSLFGKVDDPTGHKRHLLLSRAPDDLPFPIQRQRLLGKALALAHWPSFAIHFQIFAALPHHMATYIGPVDMQFR